MKMPFTEKRNECDGRRRQGDRMRFPKTMSPGTDAMILKIFSLQNLVEILSFFAQTTASFGEKRIVTLGFEKNAKILAENWQKSNICDHNIDPR
jgi:hypothetical protein